MQTKTKKKLFNLSLDLGDFSARMVASVDQNANRRTVRTPSKKKLIGLALLLATLSLASCSIANQEYQAEVRETEFNKEGQPSKVVEKNVRTSSTQGTLQVPTTR